MSYKRANSNNLHLDCDTLSLHWNCNNEANCNKMIEIGELANFCNGESGDININGDLMNQVSDVKHANGYSGYSEVFSHSHRFNAYDLPTTVREGKTQSEIDEDRDKHERSLDVQKRKQLEHQGSYKPNSFADTASENDYIKLNEMIYYPTKKRHECDLCDYSTKNYGNLMQHKLIHTGKKPYKCDLCDF